MALPLRARFGVVFSALLLTSTVLPTPAFADDGRAQLAEGDKAARAKDWAKALAAYGASNAAQASADAQEGLASAHYELKHDAEAYGAYDAYLKTYGAKAPFAKKKNAETRLKELGDKTGLLQLEVAEPGATISVDDKPLGNAPMATPVRLSVGPHHVRVTKPGFLPFDQVPAVAAGATTNVAVKLEVQSNRGRVVVKEKSGQAVRVFVDGVDMGEAPWSGEVVEGAHQIGVRSATVSAPPQGILVERNKTVDVELVAVASNASLKIQTNDGKGFIYLDDKLVGEGSYAGEVLAGPHKIRVVREGYEPFLEDILAKEREPQARSVTLKLSSMISTGPISKEKSRLEGVYGGFGLLGTAQPGGMKSSLQKLCSASDRPVELGSCDEGAGLGGGVSGFVGYHWDPVGVELFVAGQYDQSAPKLGWNASSTDPGIGPDPARTESFTIHRFGGLGALRIRLTVQGEKLRFSVAGGVGLSFRAMALTRDTSTPTGAKSLFVPDPQSYVSPVLSLEPSLQYRITPTISASLGLALLVESPNAFNSIPTTKADGSQLLLKDANTPPLGQTTPAYDLATSTQIYLGPFIGMMFGP